MPQLLLYLCLYTIQIWILSRRNRLFLHLEEFTMGQEVIKMGIRWKVGTSDVILGSLLTSFCMYMPPRGEATVVCHLISRDGDYNEEVVNKLFRSIDIKAIQMVPLSVYPQEDCFRWHFDVKGSYTVLSEYRLCCCPNSRVTLDPLQKIIKRA
ncbi:Hypothetical predicted protein [Olea europaea subsp. europaea]|uniref:Uncharacterized protein n=1 Tax=Olea europaea subsp. europaea TaxID=158383 RepID=A0A8S0UK31_OLEEU|nr:Hypothetical predicted protein [Olea europaea subsp. europaea]